MGYGHSYMSWMVLEAVAFIFACLIFSIIFWTTKHWLEGTVKKKKKK